MVGGVRGVLGQSLLTGGTLTKMKAKLCLITSVRVGVTTMRRVLRSNTMPKILFTALIGTQVHVLRATLLGSTSQVPVLRLASSRRDLAISTATAPPEHAAGPTVVAPKENRRVALTVTLTVTVPRVRLDTTGQASSAPSAAVGKQVHQVQRHRLRAL